MSEQYWYVWEYHWFTLIKWSSLCLQFKCVLGPRATNSAVYTDNLNVLGPRATNSAVYTDNLNVLGPRATNSAV